MRAVFAIALSCLLLPFAFAEEERTPVGNWTIETFRTDSSFKGWAQVLPSDDGGKSYPVVLITEDKCCGGNYARVKQSSTMTITDGEMFVESEIEEFLIRDEPVEATYYPDDFYLRWENEATLEGSLNTYTDVVWKRTQNAIS